MEPVTAPLVVADDLGHRFGGVVALEGVSLSVEQGRIWAIVGANASGKSTLIRLLAKLPLEGASSGRVRFGGSEARASDLASLRAFVPQRPSLSAGFTAAEVVALGRAMIGRRDGAVERALDDVGLSHRAAIGFHELSGGERQRVAIARALAQVDQGGVLFLDEPFAGIDPAEVARLVGVLRRRAARGAVVLSLHDPGLARAFASDAVVLRAGRVVASGPSRVVLTIATLSGAYGHPMRAEGDWFVPELG
jgi:iron complex transport system ATP-binding protein